MSTDRDFDLRQARARRYVPSFTRIPIEGQRRKWTDEYIRAASIVDILIVCLAVVCAQLVS